ncbi:MAG TPA: outer membrane protein assembly factor BamE [Xanthobacteraceae bacterium]|nr:outer membrane protein assembly factor BamE [Xanthobacteraceae bacterium]
MHKGFRSGHRLRVMSIVAALATSVLVGGCFTEIYNRGFMVPEGALEQIPMGATQEQVLIVLGTPSTVATVNGEVFYYISQRSEQTAFMPPKIVDQRVIAVYFDKNRRVERLADYGLQDGKLFDFVSRTTPTSGKEVTSLTYMFKIFGAQ